MVSEYEDWLRQFDEDTQDSILVSIRLLQESGPFLSRPHADTLKTALFKTGKSGKAAIERGRSMTINFKEFYKEIPEERQIKIEKRVEKELRSIRLSEVRNLVKMTQKDLAEKIDVSQAAISKMEHQKDLNISTLRKLIEAVGGKLDVTVRLPDKPAVRLETFSSADVSAKF